MGTGPQSANLQITDIALVIVVFVCTLTVKVHAYAQLVNWGIGYSQR